MFKYSLYFILNKYQTNSSFCWTMAEIVQHCSFRCLQIYLDTSAVNLLMYGSWLKGIILDFQKIHSQNSINSHVRITYSKTFFFHGHFHRLPGLWKRMTLMRRTLPAWLSWFLMNLSSMCFDLLNIVIFRNNIFRIPKGAHQEWWGGKSSLEHTTMNLNTDFTI